MFDPMTIGVLTLATAAAAGGYSAYQANKQTKEIKKQAAATEDAARVTQQKQDANQMQSVMLNQKRRAATGTNTGALRDTILTGPLGVPNQTAGQGGKTLLGM